MSREIRRLVALAAILTVAEITVPASWHVPPGVTALFSLVGCVTIVLVSKALGKHWLQRPEPSDE